MKKARFNIPLALLCGLAITAGCSRQVPSPDVAFEKEVTVGAYTLANSASVFDNDKDITAAGRMSLLMPVALMGNDVLELQQAIRTLAYDNHDGSTVDDFFRTSIAEFGFEVEPLELPDSVRAALTAGTSALADFDGYVDVDGYVECLTPYYMSYAVNSSEYAPHAAHGIYSERYVNYDLGSGHVFGLADLVTADGMAALPSVIARKARSMAGSLGVTSITSLPADSNFTVSPRGDLVFVYQPYEVASYVQGLISVPIPAYSISDYLTDYGRRLLMNE